MICPHCHKEIEPVEETISSIAVVKDKNGNIQTWTEEIRDIDGVLIKKRVDEYGYFENGGINTIIMQVFDGNDTLQSQKTLIHKSNGCVELVDSDIAKEMIK